MSMNMSMSSTEVVCRSETLDAEHTHRHLMQVMSNCAASGAPHFDPAIAARLRRLVFSST